MTDKARWTALIGAAVDERKPPVQAVTYLETRSSASKPVKVSASDGLVYFVKGGHCKRQLVNDHIVGRLGNALGAPTAVVAHVDVSSDLVDAEPMLGKQFPEGGRFPPGIWHGSLAIDGVSNDREGIAHSDVDENRPRFALLAILYGWIPGADHQFLYNNQPPRLVHSCDHGHFFHGGPDWTIASLAAAPVPQADPTVVSNCSLSAAELRAAAESLDALQAEAAIAGALGNVLDHWAVSSEEIVAVAQYLTQRRLDLLSHIAQLPQ